MSSPSPRQPHPEGWRLCLQSGAAACARLLERLTRRRFFLPVVFSAALFIAGNLGIAIAVSTAAHHEASDWPAEGFRFTPARDWQTIERKIQAVGSPRLTRSILGMVSYAQGSLPVHLLSFAPARSAPRPLRVLLVSGVHGTETAGPQALLELAAWMARDPSRFADARMDIVPVVNPWGWVYGYRYDGDGEDVNRDFSSHRTQEARFIKDLMRKDGPYDLVMDLHETARNAYFIYQYVPPSAGLGSEYMKVVASMHRPTAHDYSEWIFAVHDGILRTPAAALFWIGLGRSMALDQYARIHGVRNAYTVETPSWDDFDTRVAVHLRTVQAFLTRLTAERAGR